MNTSALPASLPHLDSKPGKMTVLLFGGAIYTATSLSHDVQASGSPTTTYLPLAWVLTLPMAMLLSGSLYWLLNKLFQ